MNKRSAVLQNKGGPSFLIADNWSHIFDFGEKETRFVFDKKKKKIIFMEIRYDQKWNSCSKDAMSDVEDSLVNGNEDAIENPQDWGLNESDKLPTWFK